MESEKIEKSEIKTRRTFLKKLVYSAPLLVEMGQFVKPTHAHADGTGGPEGPPGGFLNMSPKKVKRIKRQKPQKPQK